MNRPWLNSVLPIALLFSFRMLGLFMLIPVFTPYAKGLEHATPELIGIALGGYGLSQGLLQIPFGMLSDRFGRIPLLVIGLILFACGSLFGALTHSIYGMIIARIIQGAGAIGSVLIALLADLTSESQRTKAMAVIGATIGLSFSLAMVISPGITHAYGLSGVFYLTFGLALAGLLLLTTLPSQREMTPITKPIVNIHTFKQAIKNPALQRLNLGIFFQHLILTATFFVIPLALQQKVQQGHLSTQWHFYLPIMVAAFLTMIPLISMAERKQRVKRLFLGAILITAVSQFTLCFAVNYWHSLIIMMFAYFVAFNSLEATLPSLISKQANPANRGTAMGIYSSSQFLGIFVGGSLSGLIYSLHGNRGVFFLNGMISVVWFMISYRMSMPTSQNKLIKVNNKLSCPTTTVAANASKIVQ